MRQRPGSGPLGASMGGLPGHRGGARPDLALRLADLAGHLPPPRVGCPCRPLLTSAQEVPGDFGVLKTGRSVWRVVAGAAEGPTAPWDSAAGSHGMEGLNIHKKNSNPNA